MIYLKELLKTQSNLFQGAKQEIASIAFMNQDFL